MAGCCVRICRFISFLNLLYIWLFYTIWQPKGLCYPIMTKFNAKASFIQNNQELKFPRWPISIWYKLGPTCLVLPIDLTVHMDVELNPGPLQKKQIHLLTCLPAISVISGLVSHTNDKLLSTNYADTRHVGFCGPYYSDVYHRFSYRPCSLPLSSTYRRCRVSRRVREKELETFAELNPWFLNHALAEEAIICIKDPFQITSASLHLWIYTITYLLTLLHTNLFVNPRPTFLNFAVFNSRSVRNKIESIIDHVVENDIGLCTDTEIMVKWHWFRQYCSVTSVTMTPRNLWIYWKRLVFRNSFPARPIYRVIPWI